MPSLLIHNNEITYRGDATNTQNVALMLKEANVETVVVIPKSDRNHQSRIGEIRNKNIAVEEYQSRSDLFSISSNYQVTHSMFVHDGRYNNLWIPETKHLVHAVFNNYEPHGDVYAYVSEWLYSEALKKKIGRNADEVEKLRELTNSPFKLCENVKKSWVPHTVMPEKGDGSYFRKLHKIPGSAFLVGRIGGYTEFSDLEARKAVLSLLDEGKDVSFAFINTKPFVIHPRVKYIGYVSESQKWDFYDACDLLLNGRLMGESFGFSIVEPLMLGKPIIAPDISRNLQMDKHHVQVLKPLKLLYTSGKHLNKQIKKIMESPFEKEELQSLVRQFTKDEVRKRFVSVFLD